MRGILLLFGCVVIFGGLIVFGVLHDNCVGPFRESSRNLGCIEKRFAPAISGYASMADWPQKPGSPYLKGRAVLVDIRESTPNGVSQMFHSLPDSLLAFNPSQADSVILLMWKKDVVGRFPSGYASYRVLCEVIVVDVTARAVVGRVTFQGGNAPTAKPVSVSGDVGGPAPDHEIVAWIKALPRT